MSRLLALPVALLLAGTAHAGDKPLYATAPDWVKPAPDIDGAKLAADTPALLEFDEQQRLQDGQVWKYRETAVRAVSTEALSRIGTLQFTWQPSHGDLIVHKVEIIRGSEHIDLLKGKQDPFTVLRREQQLNNRTLDGMLTATMQVPDLRVGDVLRVTTSTTIKDPTLQGKLQTGDSLPRAPLRLQFGRLRLIWPEKLALHWKGYNGSPLPDPVAAGSYRELTVPLPLAKPDEMPGDAPIRFQKLPIVEATDFSGWEQVSSTMAPLYKTDGLIDPNGPIAPEIAKIMAAGTDPVARAAAALRLVQDKIRYQAITLGTGNYVPQPPAETWSLRYGDCKAKTLLLLAILRQMGIDAEPVLASAKLGGLVSSRLPSAGAFDHIFVKATVNGRTLWLDGTKIGDRQADLDDVPPLGWVLPLRPAGATLIELPHGAPARPTLATVTEIDGSAGLRLPAPFRISLTLRGANTEVLRQLTTQAGKDDIDKALGGLVRTQLPNAMVTDHSVSFDDAAGTTTITASGVVAPGWRKEDDLYKSTLDHWLEMVRFAPDRARPSWHDLPVATAEPGRWHKVEHITLPRGGKGFTLEGGAPMDVTVAGVHYVRNISLSGDRISLDVTRAGTGEEIPAAAVSDERKRFAAATAQPPRAVAPADYPSAWAEAGEAKRLKKLDPLIAAYAKHIADKPDDAPRYAERAQFYERVFERQQAIDDLTKAISIAPSASFYIARAALYRQLKQMPKAMADFSSATELDPKSAPAINNLARLKADTGDMAGALDLLQQHIDEGGDDRYTYLATKAEIQAEHGNAPAALTLLDDAITRTPGQAMLLNSRCWIKGTQQLQLDTALKDCTKAIELSDGPAAALDSRAMVYFRLHRLDDALADLAAALTRNPDLPGSLYLRGVIRRETGDKNAGDADIAAARGLRPEIDTEYRKYGFTVP